MNAISLTPSKSSYFGKCSFLNFPGGKLSSRRVVCRSWAFKLNLSDYLTSEISSLAAELFVCFVFFIVDSPHASQEWPLWMVLSGRWTVLKSPLASFYKAAQGLLYLRKHNLPTSFQHNHSGPGTWILMAFVLYFSLIIPSILHFTSYIAHSLWNDVEKEIINSRNMAPKEMVKNDGRVWTPLHTIYRSLVCWAWGWGGEERVAV